MATPFDEAIVALEEEIRGLQATVEVLRRRQAAWGKPSAVRASKTLHAEHREPERPDVTNEEAVDAILKDAHPDPLSIRQITERGPTVGGRELNPNSVRWITTNGQKDGTIEKIKNKRGVRFRLVNG